MSENLLAIPNYAPQAGRLPNFKADYLGYYDSGDRQLVFVFRRDLWSANIYISTCGWENPCAVMNGPRLPKDIILFADEAQWLYFCWSAAMRRFGRVAPETVIARQFRFESSPSDINAVTRPTPISKVCL